MVAAADMTNISIPGSFGISVLGMVIVFIVLIFLMIIVYIMTAIVRKVAAKPAAAAVTAGAAAVSPATIETKAVAMAVAGLEPGSEAEAESASDVPEDSDFTDEPELPYPAATDVEAPSSRKYRVIVNGVEYEVDAGTGDTTLSSTLDMPTAAEAAETKPRHDAVTQASTALPTASAFESESTGIRKFKVIVNGAEYEVDSETSPASPETGTGRV